MKVAGIGVKHTELPPAVIIPVLEWSYGLRMMKHGEALYYRPVGAGKMLNL